MSYVFVVLLFGEFICFWPPTHTFHNPPRAVAAAAVGEFAEDRTWTRGGQGSRNGRAMNTPMEISVIVTLKGMFLFLHSHC